MHTIWRARDLGGTKHCTGNSSEYRVIEGECILKVIVTTLIILFSTATFSETYSQEAIFSSGTSCLGDCPVYRFYYFSDGSYVFEGERHTSVLGMRHGNIGTEYFDQLVAVMKKYKFHGFSDHYGWGNREVCEELRTDYPFITTRHQKKEESFEVHHYTGCIGFERESELEEIENEISRLLVKEGLIKP